jgi:Glycine zipper
MRKRHDRLTKYGVVALAGIAVLGWVREPEKHPSSNDSASAGSAQSRPTFSPPGEAASVHASPATSERIERTPLEADQRTAAVEKARKGAPANAGRHEGPSQQPIESGTATRSREPQEERPLDPEPTDPVAQNPERTNDNDAANGQTQPVVAKKDRSTAKSTAIIVGAAAAGAAIGAATGGGKGAAIGAISGGAGGYVYDRMTRRKSVGNVPTVTDSGKDPLDGPGYDRAPSLARRFGTPTFN